MASITTILGTDSVSSSRIVINNNFNALNTELAQFAAVLNTTAQTLSLNGEVKGGTLRANNGTIDTFKVTNSEFIANVEGTFNQKVTLNDAIILAIEEGVTTLPNANSYASATYILTASSFTSPIALNAAEDGQEIALIADGGTIEFDTANIAGATTVEVFDGGSITLRYSAVNSLFYVISSINSDVIY
jgi:hypothetical protein